MRQAHQAADRAKVAPAAGPPPGPDGASRIDGIAERAFAESRKPPRIRRLW
jgi:hypothetical protein